MMTSSVMNFLIHGGFRVVKLQFDYQNIKWREQVGGGLQCCSILLNNLSNVDCLQMQRNSQSEASESPEMFHGL